MFSRKTAKEEKRDNDSIGGSSLVAGGRGGSEKIIVVESGSLSVSFTRAPEPVVECIRSLLRSTKAPDVSEGITRLHFDKRDDYCCSIGFVADLSDKMEAIGYQLVTLSSPGQGFMRTLVFRKQTL